MKAAIQTQMEHAPGSFCWVELATTDGRGAKRFYSELFGWEANDNPIGPNMIYTMLVLNGRVVGALYQKPETMKDVPTQWMSYIRVRSADETAARAEALGGTIVQPPFDVMEQGRMAIVADPTGAYFSIWQPKQFQGVGIKGEFNSLCWSELLTNDTEKANDFYTQLFGWKPKIDRGRRPYTEWINGDEPVGGMLQIQPEMGPMPPNWGIYISVDDCAAKVAKAKLLGASIHVPPTEISNVGRFAVMTDPQGALFSIIELISSQRSQRAGQDIPSFDPQGPNDIRLSDSDIEELDTMSLRILETEIQVLGADRRISENQAEIEDLKRETRAVLTRLTAEQNN